jgi:phosphatidylglycerol---prolipoprotein diacylglyceryl transferase
MAAHANPEWCGFRPPPHTMHPVLASVPWPELGIPLWPAFALLALWGAVTGVVAVRRKNHFVAVLGAVLATAAVIAAFTTGTARLTSGPLELRSWGVLFAASLALGSALVIWRGTVLGLDRELTARVCIAAAVGGVVGARIVWVLLHPAATESIAGTVAFYRGGLSAWGGLAGAVLAARLSSRESGTPLVVLLDLAAPSFAAGVVLTRLGCHLEGCDFGVPLGEAPPRFLAALGTFPKNSPAWVEHVLTRELAPIATTSLPVHPTAVYEALGASALVALAFALGRRHFRPGLVFGAVVLAYLLLRVTLDSLRDDPVEMWVSRTLVALCIVTGAYFATIRRFRPSRK